jgi:nucleoid DNA-binding protein
MEPDLRCSKSDLIARAAEATGASRKVVKSVVDTIFNDISNIVAAGGTVTIQGFARFFSKTAQPRSFRKINSGDIVEVGERDLPKTKFSKKFVERIKG